MDTKIIHEWLPPAIRVCPSDRPRDPQRTLYSLDCFKPNVSYGVHNNSSVNLRRGLMERVFYTDNRYTEPREVTGDFNLLCSAFWQDLKAYEIQPCSRESFVEHYRGPLLTRYRKALESLRVKEFRKQDSYVQTFLKAEKINFSAKPDPAPRVIQPRSARFNVEFGRFIWPMEHKVYKQLGRLYRYPCVMKGINVLETGKIIKKKWDLFKNPCVVGLDASRFDQHISNEALRFTHAVYKRFMRNPEFNKLLELLYTNTGFASSKDEDFQYVVKRGRMSGDMDTALGNCVLMVAMTYSYCKNLGIDHEVMNNGDDIVVIMDRKDLDKFMEGVETFYGSLGFKMTVEEPQFVLERLEFCQMRPVLGPDGYIMIRGLGSIAKDTVSICAPHEFDSRMAQIGVAGQAWYDGIPVFQSFYEMLAERGRPAGENNQFRNSGLAINTAGLKTKRRTPTDLTRVSFYLATGLNPDRQLDLESIFREGAPAGKYTKACFEWLDEEVFELCVPSEFSASDEVGDEPDPEEAVRSLLLEGHEPIPLG